MSISRSVILDSGVIRHALSWRVGEGVSEISRKYLIQKIQDLNFLFPECVEIELICQAKIKNVDASKVTSLFAKVDTLACDHESILWSSYLRKKLDKADKREWEEGKTNMKFDDLILWTGMSHLGHQFSILTCDKDFFTWPIEDYIESIEHICFIAETQKEKKKKWSLVIVKQVAINVYKVNYDFSTIMK